MDLKLSELKQVDEPDWVISRPQDRETGCYFSWFVLNERNNGQYQKVDCERNIDRHYCQEWGKDYTRISESVN